MSKVYYNQADPRWANHPYPAPSYPNATVKSAGCGPTCGAMVISSCKEIIYPDEMCDLSEDNGYRVDGGTADDFFPFICDRWGLEIERIHSSYEAFDRCANGDFVVMCAGAGLWTTGGHFILAVGTRGDEIQIFDPYLYAGKFDTPSRQGADVSVEGNSCYVQIDKFKEYSNIQRLWAINVGAQPEPQPTPSGDRHIGDTVTINGVYTSSTSTTRLSPLVTTGTITYIAEGAPNPYLLDGGNIGWTNDDCIIGGDTPTPTPPQPTPTTRTGVVRANGGLNVRSGPSTDYERVDGISNGATVTIYEEQNGWYRIGDGEWVCGDYVDITGDTPTPTPRSATVRANGGLNVRSGPSTSYSRVGGLSNGTTVTVYSECNGWAEIGDGQWVCEDYLDFNGGASSTVGQTKKLASTTYLYSNPDLTGTVYTYKPNTTVIIKENVNSSVDKVYIPYTGRTAYCSNNVYR